MPKAYNDPEHIRPLRRAYAVAKCQAQYRSEPWDLTWEQWLSLWLEDNNWQLKGRGSRDLSCVRLNYELPWRWDNVIIEERHSHLSRIVAQKTLSRRAKKLAKAG